MLKCSNCKSSQDKLNNNCLSWSNFNWILATFSEGKNDTFTSMISFIKTISNRLTCKSSLNVLILNAFIAFKCIALKNNKTWKITTFWKKSLINKSLINLITKDLYIWEQNRLNQGLTFENKIFWPTNTAFSSQPPYFLKHGTMYQHKAYSCSHHSCAYWKIQHLQTSLANSLEYFTQMN